MNTTNHQQTLINTNNNKTLKETDSKLYKDYYERKRIAIVMEENNNSKIIAIPSLNKGNPDEWLKLGNNSAYFYKYLITPRLGKKPPTIRPDTDLNYRFKSGIIAIHWRNTFVKQMESLNLIPREESNLLIFNLPHIFTTAEIKRLHEKECERNPKPNQILKPSITYPDLYHLLLTLAKILPEKLRKLNKSHSQYYDPELRHLLAQLFKTYLHMANGHLSQPAAKIQFLTALDDFSAIMIILSEDNAFDHSSEYRLSTLILDIRNSVERNLKETNQK